MAQPTNAYDTYDQIGTREDLSDVITNISPVDTPCFSMFGTATAKNTYFEWQTETLAAASGSNAVIEGDEATWEAAVATTRLGNYTQIFDKTATVTGSVDFTDRAGRGKEMDHQVAKKTKELKRDYETSLCANTAQVAGNATTARVTAGIVSWIATNESLPSAGSPAAPTGDGTDTRTEGTQEAFTEARLKSALKQAWDSGGEPDVVVLGSFNKQVMSGFAGNSTKTQEHSKTLSTSVDVYESDFGKIQVVPNRFSPAKHVLILQKDMWKIHWGRKTFSEVKASTGDYQRKQIIGEWGLACMNEAANAIVADCTTS